VRWSSLNKESPTSRVGVSDEARVTNTD